MLVLCGEWWWQVPLATVQAGVAYYIVTTGTADGRAWATHKRFSEFVAFRAELLCIRAPGDLRATAVGQVPFPAKAMWGGTDASRMRERTKELNVWMMGILKLCRPDGDKDLAMFLAQDDEGLDLTNDPKRMAQIDALSRRAETQRVPLRVCNSCFEPSAAPAEMEERKAHGVEGVPPPTTNADGTTIDSKATLASLRCPNANCQCQPGNIVRVVSRAHLVEALGTQFSQASIDELTGWLGSSVHDVTKLQK